MSASLGTSSKRGRRSVGLNRLRIGFFAEGDGNQQSTVHRVLAPAAGLRGRGHDVSVILGRRLSLGSRQVLAPSPASFFHAVSALRHLDVLLVHRTANLLTAALIDLARLTGLKTVYDFDDALYLIRNPVYGALNSCIATSDLVIAGSHELLGYATSLNHSSVLGPSSVDTELFHPRLRRKADHITIGWLGHGPLHRSNLAILRNPLKRLARDETIRFKLISPLGDRAIEEMFNSIPDLICHFGQSDWRRLEEMPQAIADFDIGVMPLTDDAWSRAKCGQKLVEYMSMGIPVIASAVGENNYIVNSGVDGFLVRTDDDWIDAMSTLVRDETLREAFGREARAKAEREYSLEVYLDNLENRFGVAE